MGGPDHRFAALGEQLGRIERNQYRLQQSIWLLVSIAAGVLLAVVFHLI